jgi:hypothetical protein
MTQKPQAIQMSSPRTPAPNPHSDGQKANTRDKHRNDDAHGKEPDQPEAPRTGRPDPEKDYPDTREKVPR